MKAFFLLLIAVIVYAALILRPPREPAAPLVLAAPAPEDLLASFERQLEADVPNLELYRLISVRACYVLAAPCTVLKARLFGPAIPYYALHLEKVIFTPRYLVLGTWYSAVAPTELPRPGAAYLIDTDGQRHAALKTLFADRDIIPGERKYVLRVFPVLTPERVRAGSFYDAASGALISFSLSPPLPLSALAPSGEKPPTTPSPAPAMKAPSASAPSAPARQPKPAVAKTTAEAAKPKPEHAEPPRQAPAPIIKKKKPRPAEMSRRKVHYDEKADTRSKVTAEPTRRRVVPAAARRPVRPAPTLQAIRRERSSRVPPSAAYDTRRYQTRPAEDHWTIPADPPDMKLALPPPPPVCYVPSPPPVRIIRWEVRELPGPPPPPWFWR